VFGRRDAFIAKPVQQAGFTNRLHSHKHQLESVVCARMFQDAFQKPEHIASLGALSDQRIQISRIAQVLAILQVKTPQLVQQTDLRRHAN